MMIITDREIEICKIQDKNSKEPTRHILTLKVSYNTGERNWNTGQKTPKGFVFVFRKSQIENGYKQIIVDGRGNPTTLLAPAHRYGKKKLMEIAELVQYPSQELDKQLCDAYDYCRKQWPEAAFPTIESGTWPAMIALFR